MFWNVYDDRGPGTAAVLLVAVGLAAAALGVWLAAPVAVLAAVGLVAIGALWLASFSVRRARYEGDTASGVAFECVANAFGWLWPW
jgi:hypothetical protein